MTKTRKWNGYATEEAYRKYQKDYYEKNKERILARKKADPWADKLNNAKTRAEKSGIPFDIDREFLNSIRVSHCPILGLELKYTENKKISDDSATLDRINPCLGYVPGNVQILSHKGNRMKSNATPEELRQFAQWILSEYPARAETTP